MVDATDPSPGGDQRVAAVGVEPCKWGAFLIIRHVVITGTTTR
ncbi:hypothetical protein N801_00335 [Knoellia aerolata DSM 18566]|uniref:Uncharacterized protein n=1 Tax=Knoellia aerolata DSM 18566 TaxID=1385519 RepID=A0A0A0JPR6_9MICO|nr:hypothetical protein N801_00335 [Knoellia aerolata DSM 18566]